MLIAIGQFFLSEWIFSITWAFWHLPFNVILMYFFAKFVMRINSAYLFLLCVTSHIFSFLMFSALSWAAICFFIGLDHIPVDMDINSQFTVFTACLALAFFYGAFQTLFFWVLSKRLTINWRSLGILSFLSNATTAQIIYFLFSVHNS